MKVLNKSLIGTLILMMLTSISAFADISYPIADTITVTNEEELALFIEDMLYELDSEGIVSDSKDYREGLNLFVGDDGWFLLDYFEGVETLYLMFPDDEWYVFTTYVINVNIGGSASDTSISELVNDCEVIEGNIIDSKDLEIENTDNQEDTDSSDIEAIENSVDTTGGIDNTSNTESESAVFTDLDGNTEDLDQTGYINFKDKYNRFSDRVETFNLPIEYKGYKFMLVVDDMNLQMTRDYISWGEDFTPDYLVEESLYQATPYINVEIVSSPVENWKDYKFKF